MLHASEGAPDERAWVGTPHPIMRITKEAISFILFAQNLQKKVQSLLTKCTLPNLHGVEMIINKKFKP